MDVKYNPETGRPEYLDDDADDDSDSLLTRCPVDMTPLIEAMQASQGCLLLLVLKEYLKEVYGITDGLVVYLITATKLTKVQVLAIFFK